MGSEWIRCLANSSMFHRTVQSDWRRKWSLDTATTNKNKQNASKLDLTRFNKKIMVLTPMGHPKRKTRRPTKHPRKPEKPKDTIEPCESNQKTFEKAIKKQKKQRSPGDTGSVMVHLYGIFVFFVFFLVSSSVSCCF